MKILVLFISIVLVLPMADAAPVDFAREVRPIFQQHCYTCHSATEKKSGLRLDVKASALKGGRHHGPDIIPGDAKQSPLFHFITENNPKERMPREGAALSTGEIETISRWIDEGAKWPDGIDEVKQDHWSFKPLKISEPPEVRNAGWPRNVIDRYILAQLEHAKLKPAPPADRTTWLRRVSLDLTGLPPTPEQMAEFLKDTSPDAFEWVVDDLLASPRYGERWAQHWLDVVRFADTHGFEVNTERPNAWPYRDYVIRAFNQDTPYDQFIREQIAGDATGADAATGFLVTASVLLPGQIGQDEPSKRLARQDALDEIVVNIGQSFLGLSVGCARCHDHRFDPISQKDYYAMQAFVAGVEYKDRPWRRPEAEARRKQADRLKARSTDIDIQLARFVPQAHVGSTSRAPSNAKMNTESFAALGAKFVRFTIHDANLHPSLGLIEPCLDEFEIFTDENPPRNVALASFGTRVTASGSRASKNHQLKFVNDGQYGNSRSWISNQPGQGWVLFELPEKMRINRIVWGRDRTEKYQDRLATAYTLEAGLSPETMSILTFVPPLRPSVQPDENTDRFAPVKARQIRFTILSTMANNRREPCIDELEVFNTAGNNIALASAGAVSQTSGSMTEANRHELRFLNDGNYGNSRS
ncbi:MAG: DUF1549 domain-containing protein, partial [Planctomycetes bacterium]|nr:DUF1549 domain-containing protein [Planctomycetota bacterium]